MTLNAENSAGTEKKMYPCRECGVLRTKAEGYIYGEIQPLADAVLPTYCGCNQLIENIEQLERHVECGCWSGE